MGLTGDRYVGAFNGHSIELVRNNWTKTLKLLIDGAVVASKLRILPCDLTLSANLPDGDTRHTVIVNSVLRFPRYEDSIEVNGAPIVLTKTK